MKKFIRGLVLAVLVFGFTLPAMGAGNVFNVTELPMAIQITVCDTAWTWTTHWTDNRHARGIKVDYILFSPGAATDIVTIHEGSATGPVIARFYAVDLITQYAYFNGALIRPYLAAPAGAVNAAAFITIKLSDQD